MGTASEGSLLPSLQMMKAYAQHGDADGQIVVAREIEAACASLIDPEVLLRGDAVSQLIQLLGVARAEAQIAGCYALSAACRFEAIQQVRRLP